jgi:hypothetical protein
VDGLPLKPNTRKTRNFTREECRLLVTPCGSCKNRSFGGTIVSIIKVTRISELGPTLAVTSNRSTLRRSANMPVFLRSMLRLVVTANVPSSPILVTLMMEETIFSETSVLTRATQHNIPEDGIPHSHRRRNLKSHNFIRDSKVMCHYFYQPLVSELGTICSVIFGSRLSLYAGRPSFLLLDSNTYTYLEKPYASTRKA